MQPLTRFPDWTERLQIYLDRVRHDRFEWGEHDCVLFVNGAVKAITGHDFIGDIVGQYSSKIEAARWLRDNGFGTLVEAVTAKLGEPVHVAQAGRGDIVMKGKAIGVAVSHGWSWFIGEEVANYGVNVETGEAFFVTHHGLVSVPTLHCDRAWKVAPVIEAEGD